MDVILGEKWEQFVEERVKSGEDQTAEDVLREGLKLLLKKDLRKQFTVSSKAELESRLVAAIESLDRGEGVDGEEVFARIRSKLAARIKNG